jgi:hypothetical protein
MSKLSKFLCFVVKKHINCSGTSHYAHVNNRQHPSAFIISSHKLSSTSVNQLTIEAVASSMDLLSTFSLNAYDHTTSRRVYVNVDPPDDLFKNGKPLQVFPSNKISTSKYNIFTFIPKNLYEQFR